MQRTLWTLSLGIVCGAISVLIFRTVGDYLFPPPVPVDILHPDQVRDLHASLPISTYLNSVLSWCLGAFVAASVSGVKSRSGPGTAWTAGFVIAGAGAVLLFLDPHPTWVPLLTLSLGMIFAWTAGRVFADPGAKRFGTWL